MGAITWLADVGRKQAETVGAKAANLGELTRAGLPVPAGFVVCAGADLDAMEEGGVAEELRALHAVALGQVDEPDALGRSAERLRALVRKAGVPSRLGSEVIAASHRLGQSIPVAVRSSALREDGEAASFAGMYDSYTNVIGDEAILGRLLDCWVSLFGERVIAFRAARGIAEEPAIAVLMQQFVAAGCAGVMFTADPATGDTDRIVVEASFGLGEVATAARTRRGDNSAWSRREPRVPRVGGLGS